MPKVAVEGPSVILDGWVNENSCNVGIEHKC